MNESKKMALLAVEALEDKKAEDITIIDISEVSVLADYFIIADGSNRNQVQAMADSAEEALGRAGYDAKQIEGYQSANWILMDYKDIIVHVFSKEDRAFYDLERIWRDGKQIPIQHLLRGRKYALYIVLWASALKLLFIIRYHQIAACIYLIRLHIITLLYLMDILINICKSRMI